MDLNNYFMIMYLVIIVAAIAMPDSDSKESTDLTKKLENYEGVLEDISTNYDCDVDSHKYGTHCRACIAKRALDGKDWWRDD